MDIIRPTWFIILFKSSIFIYFFLTRWSILTESGRLKFPTIIVEPSISTFKSVNVCFLYLGAMMFSEWDYNCYIFLMNLYFHQYLLSFFSLVLIFDLKCLFFWYQYSYSTSLWLPLFVSNGSHFQLYVFVCFSNPLWLLLPFGWSVWYFCTSNNSVILLLVLWITFNF